MLDEEAYGKIVDDSMLFCVQAEVYHGWYPSGLMYRLFYKDF
jgi:hypothetical protein